MSLFTLNKNNLGDLEDLKKARKNLGLGTIAIQESNDVTIDGGHISIKDFQLRNTHNSSAQIEGMFMVSDEHGYAYWREYDSIRENSNLRLSGFCNDAPFATVDEVAQCLQADQNLGDLTDVGHAITNLGLGHLLEENEDGSLDPIAYRNLYNAKANNLRTSNLIVTEDLDIRKQIRLTYLNQDGTLQTGNFLRLDTKSNTIQAMNLSSNIEDTHDHTIPNSFLLNSIYNELSNVTYVSFSNIDAKLDRITVGSNYLEQMNNLSDVNDKAAALSNLGLDGLTTVDNRLTASNIQIHTGFRLGTSTTDGHVLMCDAEGNGDWSEFPAATYNRRGTVNIATSYLQEDVNGKTFVPTSSVLLNAFNTLSNTFSSSRATNISAFTNDAEYLTKTNYFSEFQTREEKRQALANLDIFTEDIVNFPSGVSAFQNDVGYLKLADKLGGFDTTDLPSVRSNLGLSEVAQTGDYNSLCNIPPHLDNSTLTAKFLVKSSNLSDIDNLDLVKTNLGLREMAFYDRNNVSITGGAISGLNSITTDELILLPALEANYTITDYVNDLIFLKATSSSGTGSWGRIPTASTTNKGVVQLSEDINSTGNGVVYSSVVLQDKLSIMTSDIATLTANQNDGTSLTLSQNLSVGNDTTIANNLSVGGDITANGKVYASDGLVINGSLSFSGGGQLPIPDDLEVSSLKLRTTLSVGGAITGSDTLSIAQSSHLAGGLTSGGNIAGSGTLSIAQGVTMGGSLSTGGSAFFNDNMVVNGSISIATDLVVNNLTVNGNSIGVNDGITEIPRDLFVDSITASNVHVNNNILPTTANCTIGSTTNKFHQLYLDELYYGTGYLSSELDSFGAPSITKLLAMDGTNKAVWLDSDIIFQNNINVINVTTAHYDTIRVNHIMQYADDSDTTDDENIIIKDRSFLVSDEHGTMHWNSNVRIKEEDDGLIFNERMTMFQSNNMFVIGSWSSNETTGVTVVNKHIFR